MQRVENEIYLNILANLELHGDLFYHMVNCNGRIFWDQMIPTAMVTFDDNGQHLDLHINRKFWDRISETKRLWVIVHELLHVAYGHGILPNGYDMSLYNIACDLVVNQNSIKYYGFSRAAIDAENRYCWIDTVFPQIADTVPEGKTSDFYYNLLVKSDYQPTGLGGEVMDFHPTMKPGDVEAARNWFSTFNDYVASLPNEVRDAILNQTGPDSSLQGSGGTEAGSAGGGSPIVIPPSPPIKKKKWETVIKRWALKFKKSGDTNNEQWALTNRRNMLLDTSLMLPSDHEDEVISSQNNKIEVYFFLDTSGSCAGLAPRFWKAASSLDPKKFKIRLFCFDTSVYETTLESRKLYGFGGTRFDILETRIQNIIAKEKVKYPKAVFVLTDGYGSRVHPQNPKVWYWFLTGSSTTTYIPNESSIHKLANYE